MPARPRATRTAATAVAAATTLAAVAAALLAASPVHAATGDPAADSVIASDSTAPPVRPARAQVVGIDADIPSGLTITGAQGKSVTLTTRGQKARTAIGRDGAPVVFTKLTPGTTYTVYVGGTKVGTARPVAIPTRAWGLMISTTGTPGVVSVSWQHTGSSPQGRVAYVVTATPRGVDGQPLPGGHEISVTVTGPTAQLTGLDPRVLYTFSVAATNSAGHGEPSTAVMSRTLGDIFGPSDITTNPAPAPKAAPVAPAPAAIPAPAPAGPSTRTVYVCPVGYVDAGDACTDTKAYTFHTETVTLTYSFHTVTTGPAPMLDSYETAVAACPGGYNLEDYGWVKYCRRYGTAPTAQVKDVSPTGYTDNGTAWVRDVQVKDTAPIGYADSGTAWVKTVGKSATTVPA